MPERDLIQMDGTVTECLPKRMLRIALDNGSSILASYPLRANLKILPGDRVRVELKPEELATGRITLRYRKK